MTPTFSIITITEPGSDIKNTYASLLRQTVTDWEWLLVYQGMLDSLPDDVVADPRVTVTVEIGKTLPAIKHVVYGGAKGKIFVGVDAGDRLVPNSLQVLEEVMKTPGGYYSDFVVRRENESCVTYASEDGWETYPVTIDEKEVTAVRAFDPSARSLCDLAFSPFRLQAWHRITYELIGGYDAGSAAAEDFELWCRAYMHQAMPVLRRIPQCLYERYEDRVVKNEDREKDNLTMSNNFRSSNMGRLIDAEILRNGTQAWSIQNEHEDYKVVPLDPRLWPTGHRNSVGVISAVNVLSLLPAATLHEWMTAAYHALVPGGWLIIENPSSDGRAAFQNPLYTTFLNQNTFFYFTQRHWSVPAFGSDYQARYQAVRLWTASPGEWYNNNNFFNVRADLCALKGQRQPGRAFI